MYFFVCLTVHKSVYFFVCLTVHKSVYFFVCLTVHKSVYFFVCLTVHTVCVFLADFGDILCIGSSYNAVWPFAVSCSSVH